MLILVDVRTYVRRYELCAISALDRLEAGLAEDEVSWLGRVLAHKELLP